MSTAVTYAMVNIPTFDANGTDTFASMTAFAENIAALTSDGGYTFANAYRYNTSGTYQGGLYVLSFFILATNDTAALALYTAYKASLATGTDIQIVYSTQTLGV